MTTTTETFDYKDRNIRNFSQLQIYNFSYVHANILELYQLLAVLINSGKADKNY